MGYTGYVMLLTFGRASINGIVRNYIYGIHRLCLTIHKLHTDLRGRRLNEIPGLITLSMASIPQLLFQQLTSSLTNTNDGFMSYVLVDSIIDKKKS